MNVSFKVSGIEGVVKALEERVKVAERKIQKATQESVLLIRRDAVVNAPVDTGNLRGSAYSSVKREGRNTVGEVGFNAKYAVYVHEIDANYRVGGWKYLERSVNQNLPKIKLLFWEAIRK